MAETAVKHFDAADHIVATKGVARLTYYGSAPPGRPRVNDDKIVMLRRPGENLERFAG